MSNVNLYVCFIFLITRIPDVLCNIPIDLRKDFFNIYKGLAVQTREMTHTEVKRESITFTVFRNGPEPKSVVLLDGNLHILEGSKGYIVFITHGWNDKGDADWVLELKDSFLYTYPDAVVITVDWQAPAHHVYYVSSINVYDVGNIMADLIVNLVDNHKLDITQFILTGHSLGAQTSGFAGKKLQKLGKKLSRIVALDPAGPLFDGRPTDKRLNPTDADFVEVIHSDGGSFGFKDPCGTIDFFPNGGNFQPGCTRIDILDLGSVKDPVICDHARSYLYFIEAVRNPTHLVARQCTEWSFLRKTCDYNMTVPMGNLTTTLRGKFYLETNNERPYNKKEVKEQTGLFNRIGKMAEKFKIKKKN